MGSEEIDKLLHSRTSNNVCKCCFLGEMEHNFFFSMFFFIWMCQVLVGLERSLHGLSDCGLQVSEHVGYAACGLSCCTQVGCQFPKQRLNHVPCIGRWILSHWTTRGVLEYRIHIGNIYP